MSFPSSVVAPRTIENRPGVVYDADDTKTLFSEDLDAINDELVAIEKFLLGSPEGTLWNGKIVVSVSANDLVVELKTLAGADPSASSPVCVMIDGTLRVITAALSKTLADGTNWFDSGGVRYAAKERDYFVYLGYNATDGLVIGFSSIPYARSYADFSATTTNEKYCAISDIANAAADDAYRVIGRFGATLGVSATYLWTVPAWTETNLIQGFIEESRVLTWAFDETGFSSSGSDIGYYKIRGREVYIEGQRIGNLTSNSTAMTAKMPFTFRYEDLIVCLIGVKDNSVLLSTPGHMLSGAGSATVSLYKTFYSGTFTASGTKAIYMPCFSYQT